MGWYGKPPPKLMLIACAVLLASEGDTMAVDRGLADLAGIMELKKLTGARNQSVLAHGFDAIGVDQTNALRDKASVLLASFWRLHGDGQDLGMKLGHLRFLQADR